MENDIILLVISVILLEKEPIDAVRISTALYTRIEQGQWTGFLRKNDSVTIQNEKYIKIYQYNFLEKLIKVAILVLTLRR